MADIPTIEDIKRLLDNNKREILEELGERFKMETNGKEPVFLRTYQVKIMLSVSDATLHNYRAKGILKSKKIEGSHFYLKSDVLKLMSHEK